MAGTLVFCLQEKMLWRTGEAAPKAAGLVVEAAALYSLTKKTAMLKDDFV